jgi:hypothetical protein
MSEPNAGEQTFIASLTDECYRLRTQLADARAEVERGKAREVGFVDAELKKGDYVLATKYSDGDPADAWCVGFYIGPTSHGRHLVGDEIGGPGPNGFRYSGFSYVARIDQDFGDWLVKHRAVLKFSPVKVICLWSLRASREQYQVEMQSDAALSPAPTVAEGGGDAK